MVDSVRNVYIAGYGNQTFSQSDLKHNEWMTVNGTTIGPELGIGNYLANSTSMPTMILKSCIGGRSLGWDLLPPGSEAFSHTDEDNSTWTYAGYHQSPNRWKKGDKPEHTSSGAGYQYDGDTARALYVLQNLKAFFPEATSHEVKGFFWWQGEQDSRSSALASRYEVNLVHLIKDLRKRFNAPAAKFVAASLTKTSKDASTGGGQILDALLNVGCDSGSRCKHPEFQGNVATVYSYPLSVGDSPAEFNHNAETYMNVAQAMGEAMIALQAQAPAPSPDPSSEGSSWFLGVLLAMLASLGTCIGMMLQKWSHMKEIERPEAERYH